MQVTLTKSPVKLNQSKQFKIYAGYPCSRCGGDGVDRQGKSCYFCDGKGHN